LRPSLKVLFMSGYSRTAVVHQGRVDGDVQSQAEGERSSPRSAADLSSRSMPPPACTTTFALNWMVYSSLGPSPSARRWIRMISASQWKSRIIRWSTAILKAQFPPGNMAAPYSYGTAAIGSPRGARPRSKVWPTGTSDWHGVCLSFRWCGGGLAGPNQARRLDGCALSARAVLSPSKSGSPSGARERGAHRQHRGDRGRTDAQPAKTGPPINWGGRSSSPTRYPA
jgi:hypothetical protein